MEKQYITLEQAGKVCFSREEYSAALEKFKEAARLAKTKFGSVDPRYSEALRYIAWVLDAQWKYMKADLIYAELNKLDNAKVKQLKVLQLPLISTRLSELRE